MTPDQKLFNMDLEDAGFRTGVLAGRWGPTALFLRLLPTAVLLDLHGPTCVGHVAVHDVS